MQAAGSADPFAEPYGNGGNDRGYEYGNGHGYGYNGSNGDGYGSNDRGYGNGGTGPYSTNGGTGPHSTGAHASGRRPEVMMADAPGPGWEQANGGGARRAQEARSTWDESAQRGYPPRQGVMAPRNGDSVSVAARILSVADYEAASITQQASLQASMITRQVAYEATEIREAAKREADQLMQQASLQAAAVREAAEIEAAEVRTAVMSMQTELGELAERIRNTLPHPAPPRIPPTERPAASPAAGPSTRPKARPHAAPADRPPGRPGSRPAGNPAARPTGKPSARPTGKPAGGQGRQVNAMRFAAIATSALFLVAVAAGVAEVHLHGFDFFIFRATGTGETGPNGLQEDQGPGQPDAPKPTPSHIKVQPSPHSTVTVHSGQ